MCAEDEFPRGGRRGQPLPQGAADHLGALPGRAGGAGEVRRHLPPGDSPPGHRRHRYRYTGPAAVPPPPPGPRSPAATRRARPAAAGRAAPAWAAGERNFFLCLPCVRRGRTGCVCVEGGGSPTARFKIVSLSQPAEFSRETARQAAGPPSRRLGGGSSAPGRGTGEAWGSGRGDGGAPKGAERRQIAARPASPAASDVFVTGGGEDGQPARLRA